MQKINLYTKNGVRAAALFACILWALLIFSMSAEPAHESAERSGGITETIVEILVPDFEDAPKEEQERIVSVFDHVIRKIAHFGIFGVLGFLVMLASLGYFATARVHVARSLVIGILYAASDELHQYFVPGRGPKITDVFIDGAGALCGILVLLAFCIMLLKRKEKKNGT